MTIPTARGTKFTAKKLKIASEEGELLNSN
jgi:hypothetical protein